jgi:hypothetical protein
VQLGEEGLLCGDTQTQITHTQSHNHTHITHSHAHTHTHTHTRSLQYRYDETVASFANAAGVGLGGETLIGGGEGAPQVGVQ